MAEAVATAGRADQLRNTMAQMEVVIGEKEQLLTDKSVLAEELQHRKRNNLQLVNGVPTAQVKQISNLRDQSGLRNIQARVTALANVYDQLLDIGLTRNVDFGDYVRNLCAELPALLAGQASVSLTCNVAPRWLDLGAVTALGLAMTALVLNSYKHAFPNRDGMITVSGGLVHTTG